MTYDYRTVMGCRDIHVGILQHSQFPVYGLPPAFLVSFKCPSLFIEREAVLGFSKVPLTSDEPFYEKMERPIRTTHSQDGNSIIFLFL